MLRQATRLFGFDGRGPGFHDVTRPLREWAEGQGGSEGLLNLHVRHTSCSLTIQENADPDVLRDLWDALDRLAPRDHPYRHSSEGPDDMPAHVRTMLTASSLSVPLIGGRLQLGTWQGIYLIEHRDRPRPREIAAHLLTDG